MWAPSVSAGVEEWNEEGDRLCWPGSRMGGIEECLSADGT